MVARQQYLDVAKGLGILLVVLGHNQAVQQHPEAFAVIFSFHMPLFFFFSGVTFRPGIPLIELARKRWKTLLRPYLFTSFLLALAFFALKWHFSLAALFTNVVHIFYATGRVIVWQWLWFLPHLFLVNILFAVLLKSMPEAERAGALRALLFTALLIAGVYAARALWLLPTPWGQLLGLPFSADLAGITLFFFWLGFEFGRRREGVGRVLQTWWPAILAGFAALHFFFDYTLDLNYRRYDHVLVSTLMAAAGIAVTIGLSQLLVRYVGGRVVFGLEYLGRASLVIFIFHVFLQAKSLFVAIEMMHLPYWPAHALGFIGGVVAPVIVYEIIRRVPPLRAVYLPS